MSGKRNWRKAQLHGKRSVSCLDEQEYRDRDAAARWLERNEKTSSKADAYRRIGNSVKCRTTVEFSASPTSSHPNGEGQAA